MTTTIYEHNGKKYRLADERDIGKLVWRSETDFYTAMQNNLSRTSLEAYNPDAYSKYKTAFGYWQFAFVELEPEAAEPPRPRWLPEGARILGDDEIIQKGGKFHDSVYGDEGDASKSVGRPHIEARKVYSNNWTWYRPASEPTTTKSEQPAEVPTPEPAPFEKRVDLHLSASRYLAACREHTRAIEELSAASQEMRDLVKGEARKFIVKDNYDFKHHLFTVKADGTFTVEAVDML